MSKRTIYFAVNPLLEEGIPDQNRNEDGSVRTPFPCLHVADGVYSAIVEADTDSEALAVVGRFYPYPMAAMPKGIPA